MPGEQLNNFGVPIEYANIVANLDLINLDNAVNLKRAISPLNVYLMKSQRPPIITRALFDAMMKEKGKECKNSNFFLEFNRRKQSFIESYFMTFNISRESCVTDKICRTSYPKDK